MSKPKTLRPRLRIPEGRWSPEAVAAFNSAEPQRSPGELTVRPTRLELRCAELQARLDAIAAIIGRQFGGLSVVHGPYGDALVLARGKPAKELRAALKRWRW